MTGWQWLGTVIFVGWLGGLLARGFKADPWLTKQLLIGTLVGMLFAVPIVIGHALMLGAFP